MVNGLTPKHVNLVDLINQVTHFQLTIANLTFEAPLEITARGVVFSSSEGSGRVDGRVIM